MFYGKAYYICVIIDLYARKVIAYKAGKKNSTQLIKTTFKQAYTSQQPSPSLIFHTDRGANYCSKTLNDYIKSLGITRSFSRPYVPYDNSIEKSIVLKMNCTKPSTITWNFTTPAALMLRFNTRLRNKRSVNIQQYPKLLIMNNRSMGVQNHLFKLNCTPILIFSVL